MTDRQTTISQRIAAIALALSSTVTMAHPEDMTLPAPNEPGCRLIVSDKTKALYPQGLLEFAAQSCWAGPRTDIVVIGQGDLLPQGNHHMRMTPDVIQQAEHQLKKLIPADTYNTLAGTNDSRGRPLSHQVIVAAIRGSSEALNYQFNTNSGSKRTFVTVVDPVHHIHDDLASKAGLSVGSVLNLRFHFEGELLDRPSIRTMTLAHETGHGAHAHGLTIIENGRVISKNSTVPQVERMRHETEAEVDAYKYYGAALSAGVKLNQNYPAVDFLMRSLGSYYAGAGDKERPFAHAVNFGSHPEFVTTTPQQQLEGLQLFRKQLNLATAESVLDQDNGEIRPEVLATYAEGGEEIMHLCQDEAIEASERLREPVKWDSYAESMGVCMASHFDSSVFAVNGLIEMEKWDNPFKDNNVAKIFAEDFKLAASAHIFNRYMMEQAESVYQKTQRDHIPEAARQYWDKVFAHKPGF